MPRRRTADRRPGRSRQTLPTIQNRNHAKTAKQTQKIKSPARRGQLDRLTATIRPPQLGQRRGIGRGSSAPQSQTIRVLPMVTLPEGISDNRRSDNRRAHFLQAGTGHGQRVLLPVVFIEQFQR